jgi:hypothetical protein
MFASLMKTKFVLDVFEACKKYHYGHNTVIQQEKI